MKIRFGIVGGVLLIVAGVLIAILGGMLTAAGTRLWPEFQLGLFASTGISIFVGGFFLAAVGAFTFYIGLAPRLPEDPPRDNTGPPD